MHGRGARAGPVLPNGFVEAWTDIVQALRVPDTRLIQGVPESHRPATGLDESGAARPK